jgi:hypothetical protein
MDSNKPVSTEFDNWLTMVTSPENYHRSNNRLTEIISVDNVVDLKEYRDKLHTLFIDFNCGCFIVSGGLSIRLEIFPANDPSPNDHSTTNALRYFSAMMNSVIPYTFSSDDRCNYHADGRQYIANPLAKWDKSREMWNRSTQDIQRNILSFIDSVFQEEVFSDENLTILRISKL